INNIPISDEKLLYYLNETYPFWDRFKLSMFEIDMLISILYFLEEEVEWVVYEVGLGGRLDATNVITPKVIGITNVDFDHMGILGDTLDKIAYEKAGIFKKDVPIYTTETKLECLEVFSDRSQKLNAVLNQVKIPKYKGNYNFYVLGIEIELVDQGIYQIDNATLAIYLIKALELEIKDSVIKKAIENTNWPGRFERVRDNLFLDGAHNEVGVLKMLKTLSDYPRPWRVVFTALGDKDHRKMVKTLYDAVDELIITEFDFYRAASARDIAKNLNVRVIKDYKQAIDYLLKNSKGTSVVTGSLYFISDARAYLKSVE
ncbi:MAG: bifunctional folylpolyglutamate synthase/dihydrofolate synthase, partial [Erysipelothrix sp.]|nr:bifunctional folylpolyglutamate synthase/dihydrofolate synthase [Erysipelothrix sp.]